jgi:transposase
MLFDESRFGTHSKIGHDWFKKGTRTPVSVKLGFKNFYLYSSVAPTTGEECTWLFPRVNVQCMNLYLDRLASEAKERLLLVLDGAGWHKSKDLVVPENVEIMFLPPYSPELNPVERWWQYIKDRTIKNKVYDSLESLMSAVSTFCTGVKPMEIKSICSCNYVTNYF